MAEQLFSCDGLPDECSRCEVCQQVALIHLMHDEDEPEYFVPQGTATHSTELLTETAKAMGFGGENGDK